MAYYRKRPVVIEAWMWNTDDMYTMGVIMGNLMAYGTEYTITEDKELLIHTLEGEMLARHGDYVIKGVQNEFYPCDPAIFEITYELVSK